MSARGLGPLGQRGFAVGGLAALVGIVLIGAVAWSAAAQEAPNSWEARGSIRQMQRLSAEEGSVLTDSALLFTDDGGASWSAMASGTRLDGVTDAFFFTASHAWLAGVDTGSPDRLVLLQTVNGGAAWRRQVIGASALALGQVYARAQVRFVDAAHGWLLGQVATSTAFSVAELLHTTDGGASWERLPRPPAAGRFVFVDAQRGFMTGAPVSERLYRTLDGGRSWQELKLPVSAAPGMALYGLPTFRSPNRGTLAVTLRGDSPRLLTFVSRDGGRKWLPAAEVALPAGDYDEPVPAVLSASGRALALAAQGSVTLATDATQRTLPLAPQDGGRPAPAGARAVSVRALSLTEDSSCWALVAEGGCEEGSCRQVTRLLAVDASGLADEAIDELLVRTEEKMYLPLESERASSGAVISFDYGFDKCAAATTAQMQSWEQSSPYRDANIYYGGAARACSQVNLNASWVSTVFGQGWRLIPTWVGPQAPCTSYSTRFSSSPTTARNQGLAEADAAVDAAAALGLGAGTPLYYDLELYAENDASCSAAVREFVNAWTERVNDHGYLAGVYGNARNAQADWRLGVIANPPDAVWVTPWVCSAGASSCNWSPTVFGIPGLDDAYWATNERIRQYWGAHNETYGGATFNIDSDYANAPVASAEASSCQASVPAGHWKGEYFNNQNLSGSPVRVRNDGTSFLNFDWGSGSPDSSCGVPADNFSARWTRSTYFDAGIYQFDITSDDGFRLYVDGVLQREAWKDQGPTDYSVDVPLAAGDHTIKLEYYENGGGAVAKLSWELISSSSCLASVPSTSWKGEYFNNKNLSGSPIRVRNDGTGSLDFDWGSGSPDSSCGVPADNFSVRWTRSIYFDAGTYEFDITSDDGFRLYVDGVLEREAWKDQGPTTYTVDVPLAAGDHTIKLEYYENGGGAVAKLSWAPVSTGSSIFDWPLGRTRAGVVVPGHGVSALQNYRNRGGNDWYDNRYHAGIDLDFRDGNDAGQSVYNTADGVVRCVANSDTVWYPGAVVVVEHTLAGGQKLYSQYGHLDDVDLIEGQALARGASIGNILDQAGNSHLHFEIRDWLNDPVSGTCWGPGYAHADTGNGTPESQGWHDPADEIFARRPAFPASVITDITMNVRSEPRLGASVVATLAADSEFDALGVLADSDGGEHWWYEVRYSEQETAFVAGFYHGGWSGEVYLGQERGSAANGCFSSVPSTSWKGDYFDNMTLSGSPVMVRNDGTSILDFGWYSDSPSPECGFPADNFSVRWTRSIYFDAGTYQFNITSDDGFRLYVDGVLEREAWKIQGPTDYSVDVPLSAGDHTIKLEYYENGGWAVAKLSWELVSSTSCLASVPSTSWKGEYFNNQILSGSPVRVRNDGTSSLDFDWGSGSPDSSCGVPADNFSARWTRTVSFNTGTYRFTIVSDDGFRLYVDGVLQREAWKDQGPTTYTVDVSLSAGNHVVKMEYYEHGGGAVAKLSWIAVSTGPTVVVVDDLSSGFTLYGPSEYWWEAPIGYQGHMFWTYVNGSIISNYTRWTPNLSSGGPGNYDVSVFVPQDNATSQQARYRIRHNGVDNTYTVNQSVYYDQWIFIGTYFFAANGGEYVELVDATGEAGSTLRQIGFDAVKFEK